MKMNRILCAVAFAGVLAACADKNPSAPAHAPAPPSTPAPKNDAAFDPRDSKLEATTAEVEKHFGPKAGEPAKPATPAPAPATPVQAPAPAAAAKSPAPEAKVVPPAAGTKVKVVGPDLRCTAEFEERVPLLLARFQTAVTQTEKALATMQYAVDNMESRWSSGDTSKESGALKVAFEGLTGVALEIKNTFGATWACEGAKGVKFSSDRIFPLYQDVRVRVGKLRGTHLLPPQI